MKSQSIKRYQLQVVEGKAHERVNEYATIEEAVKKKNELEEKRMHTLEYGSEAMKDHVEGLSWRIIDLGESK